MKPKHKTKKDHYISQLRGAIRFLLPWAQDWRGALPPSEWSEFDDKIKKSRRLLRNK